MSQTKDAAPNTTVQIDLGKIVGRGYGEFWRFKGRYRVVKGSRASKKSKTTALWMIWALCKWPLSNVLCVRRYKDTLRDSCFADLQWAIKRLGLESDFKCTVSPMRITRQSTGQIILFKGLDDGQKITSTTVTSGVLNFVWIEEASQLNSEAEFNKLDLSIRGEVPEGYFKQITFTFNPWSDQHFLKRRFFDVKDPENVLALTTTYKCNEWLDAADLKLFEDMKRDSPRRYAVEGEAAWGRAEGLIFDNWAVRAFDWHLALRLPGAKAFCGLDFGFTDPTAIVLGIVCPEDKAIFIFDEAYLVGATNAEICKALRDLGIQREKVYCDAAEPKSIEELRRMKINAQPSIKGADSVRYGIHVMQGYKIIIHPKCEEFAISIQNYVWAKDRNGNPTGKPEHEYSHCLTGETLVHTAEGQTPIKELTGTTGRLLAWDGKKAVAAEYSDCRMTRQAAQIYRITLQDGGVIRATADHPVLTRRGWVTVSNLTNEDEILKVF